MGGREVIALGSKVRDVIGWFDGIAVARVEWLSGVVQYLVTPPGTDAHGVRLENQWIDEMRLRVLEGPEPWIEEARKSSKDEIMKRHERIEAEYRDVLDSVSVTHKAGD